MITNLRFGKSLIIYSCKSLLGAYVFVNSPVKILETSLHFTISSFISIILFPYITFMEVLARDAPNFLLPKITGQKLYFWFLTK